MPISVGGGINNFDIVKNHPVTQAHEQFAEYMIQYV